MSGENVLTYKVKDLFTNCEYYFRVKAINKVGAGQYLELRNPVIIEEIKRESLSLCDTRICHSLTDHLSVALIYRLFTCIIVTLHRETRPTDTGGGSGSHFQVHHCHLEGTGLRWWLSHSRIHCGED